MYRLFFHPLRKIPGPKHFAVSGIPLIVENHLLGYFPKKVLKYHEKYGYMVRTGPNSISISGTIGWPEVFGHSRGGRPEFGKWNDFYQLGDKTNVSLFTANREDHRRERRVVAHAFSDTAIKGQEALIMEYVDKLFAHLRKHAAQGTPTDVVKWYNFTTFDIIGDLALGESFHCLDQSDYHPWVSMIFTGIRVGSQMQALMKMPYLAWIVKLLISKEDMQKRIDNRKMSDEKVERRLALGSAPNGRNDFMTYILRHNDEKGMSHAEILGNSEGFLVAGSETTATTLSGLTYYLSTNPAAFERLQQEVRTAFPTERDITMLSTAQLKYLHACIEETLRIYPAAVETPPRVSPGEYVNGQYIPKGVSLSPVHYPWSMIYEGIFWVSYTSSWLTTPSRLSSQSSSEPPTTTPPTSSSPTPSSQSAGSVLTIPTTTRSSTRTRSQHSSPSLLAHATASARIWPTMR